MTRQNCQFLLNVCKPFIKFRFYTETYKLSQSALSRFINSDTDKVMISDKTVNRMVDEIYNSCKMYIDLYEECKKIK